MRSSRWMGRRLGRLRAVAAPAADVAAAVVFVAAVALDRTQEPNETSRAFSGRLSRSSGRRVSTHGTRLLRRPIDRPCARRFAGDWTADGMSCPPRREHLIIRLQGSPGAVICRPDTEELLQVLFIGDDWAEDHHDIEIEDADGRRLARARLPEGLEGITRLHALVAEHAPAAWAELLPEQVAGQVVVGIETDRGPWVTALRAAGYQVFAINPMSAARYRERHATSGAKSDAGDAHVLAEIVRLDRDHHRPVAGDSELVDAVKLLARAHQNAIWERTRHVLRLRSTLREFFPAALEAFDDLTASDTLNLLGRAPSPALAAKLTRGQLAAALRAARRHHVEARVVALQAILRAPALRQPPTVEPAYATVVAGQVRVIAALNAQITGLGEAMDEHFGRHPAAEIYLSQPGLGGRARLPCAGR